MKIKDCNEKFIILIVVANKTKRILKFDEPAQAGRIAFFRRSHTLCSHFFKRSTRLTKFQFAVIVSYSIGNRNQCSKALKGVVSKITKIK